MTLFSILTCGSMNLQRVSQDSVNFVSRNMQMCIQYELWPWCWQGITSSVHSLCAYKDPPIWLMFVKVKCWRQSHLKPPSHSPFLCPLSTLCAFLVQCNGRLALNITIPAPKNAPKKPRKPASTHTHTHIHRHKHVFSVLINMTNIWNWGESQVRGSRRYIGFIIKPVTCGKDT